MKLNFVLLDKKRDLLSCQNAILSLFKACFGKALDQDTWTWAYIDNPMGEPFVSLCFDEERLVGHYAVIPYNLVIGDRKLRACLSMTTMVNANYRGCGLFVEQAQRVYAKARDTGVEIIFGFPNSSSTPGFRKRLGWVLDDPDFVVTATMEELVASPSFSESLKDPALVKIDRTDAAFLGWRLTKPLQKYTDTGSMITKSYQEQKDIVFCERVDGITGDVSQKYNVLVDAATIDLKPQSVFEYQFGYLPLTDSAVGLKFKKDLIMSDVF